ncbi:MAG: hypothetical protein AAGJ31_06185 [Verrucomicrobiota bacterium]
MSLLFAETGAELPFPPSPEESSLYVYAGEMTKVLDGDTVELDIDLGFYVWRRAVSIDLYGIETKRADTPEGKAAFAWLKETLADASELWELRIRTMKPKDNGQWQAVLYVGGENVNQALVDKGWATLVPQ